MKTLYIGFYDYPYGQAAYALVNDNMEFVELDSTSFKYLYYIVCDWYSDDVKAGKEPYPQQLMESLDDYDNVVICEDGGYSYYKAEDIKNKIKLLGD